MSKLSKVTKQLLAEVISLLSEIEEKAEVMREVLCESPKFHPYYLFCALKMPKSDSIFAKDLFRFLTKNNVKCDIEEVSLFVKSFDINQDKKISYKEFLRFILPNNKDSLRQSIVNREIESVPAGVPYEIEYTFFMYLSKEISFLQMLEKAKEKLMTRYDFTIFEAYKCVQLTSTKELTVESVAQFLKAMNYEFTQRSVISFMRRIDSNFNSALSLQEFSNQILPRNKDTKTAPHHQAKTVTQDVKAEATFQSPQRIKTVKSISNLLSPSTIAQRARTISRKQDRILSA